MMHTLCDTLRQARKPVTRLAFPDGTRLLVLPESGRLLGLYPADDDANFLWTNPALATATTAAACFDNTRWPNPGGDRTWLAPEIELFVGDLARPAETYAVPAALDPGSWTLATVADATLCLKNSARLRLQKSRQEAGINLSKSFGPAANPLQKTALAKAGLRYAGYTLVTTLEVEPQPNAMVRLGIWNLLQLPQPGAMLIPTRSQIRPQIVFGAVSVDELTIEPRLVRWTMAGAGANAKIAIKAPSLRGRAGYLHQASSPGISELVVRQFEVDPTGDYVDALWDKPYDAGWVFQACCVRAGAQRFNELEYHAPAATAAVGVNLRRDESRVWAFRGPAAAIAEAAEILLGSAESITSASTITGALNSERTLT